MLCEVTFEDVNFYASDMRSWFCSEVAAYCTANNDCWHFCLDGSRGERQ